MEWISKIVDLAKIPVKLIGAICLFSASLVFMPVEWLDKMKLTLVMEDYGAYVALALLVSIAMLVIELGIKITRKMKSNRRKSELSIKAISTVPSLDWSERAVLREFIVQNKNALQLPVSHHSVARMVENGILVGVGNTGEHSLVGPLYLFSISEVVDPLLTKEFLGLPEGEPSRQDIIWVQDNRPSFMRTIERNNLFSG
ncbi:super-infection exclusion protein B [Pseudomonadota bacterium]